jgi:hypothetical protein
MFGNLRNGSAVAGKLAHAAHIAELRDHRRALIESTRFADERRLLRYGYRVYSQSDEDGILHEIFRRIGEGPRTFVEIGAGDGLENNTLFLLVQGWRGLWIEGSARKAAAARKTLESLIVGGRLHLEQHFVTAASVDETLKSLAPGPEISLLSVDIDGNDYYILRAIDSVSPRVIAAEYNAKFPADVPWVMEYNEGHRWDGTDYFGMSLKAVETLLSGKGYSLVGCNILGCNAFFVRNDLVSDPPFCSPFTAENHYEPERYFLLPAYHSGFPGRFGPFYAPEQPETAAPRIHK